MTGNDGPIEEFKDDKSSFFIVLDYLFFARKLTHHPFNQQLPAKQIIGEIRTYPIAHQGVILMA